MIQWSCVCLCVFVLAFPFNICLFVDPIACKHIFHSFTLFVCFSLFFISFLSSFNFLYSFNFLFCVSTTAATSLRIASNCSDSIELQNPLDWMHSLTHSPWSIAIRDHQNWFGHTGSVYSLLCQYCFKRGRQ